MYEFSKDPAKEVANKRKSASTDPLSELRAIGETFCVSLEDICAALRARLVFWLTLLLSLGVSAGWAQVSVLTQHND